MNVEHYATAANELADALLAEELIQNRDQIVFRVATSEKEMLTLLEAAIIDEAKIFIASHGGRDGGRLMWGTYGSQNTYRNN
ncbi:hypothetical protein MLD52_22515 [Puniceicoccaceae bacterium K14]|nr:hypothetical protein [Puniceicoccaceae bacterium K14]